jgi:hypothetical protein
MLNVSFFIIVIADTMMMMMIIIIIIIIKYITYAVHEDAAIGMISHNPHLYYHFLWEYHASFTAFFIYARFLRNTGRKTGSNCAIHSFLATQRL